MYFGRIEATTADYHRTAARDPSRIMTRMDRQHQDKTAKSTVVESKIQSSEMAHSGSAPVRNFVLNVKFADPGMMPITLSSEDIDEEESRCHDSLAAISKSLSSIERECKHLHQVNQKLHSEIAQKAREQQNIEERLRYLELKYVELQAQVGRLEEEHKSLELRVKEMRTKRYETECRLREEQLAICRRKLDLSMSIQPEDYNSEEYNQYMNEKLAIRDVELFIAGLQERLVEYCNLCEQAKKQSDHAEQLTNERVRELASCSQECERLKGDLNRYAFEMKNKTDLIGQHVRRLEHLNERKRREKRNHVEIVQTLILVDTCRRLDQVEEIDDSWYPALGLEHYM